MSNVTLEAPEEKPEWLLRCLAEVKEELKRDLISSMSGETLKLKLKVPDASKAHLASVIGNGSLKLNQGGHWKDQESLTNAGKRQQKERIRRELAHYERHCAHRDCLQSTFGLHDNARHPIILIPKQMSEEAKRDFLHLISSSYTCSPRPEISESSTPSTRPDLWSVQEKTTEDVDSDSADDFSIVADGELDDYQMPSDGQDEMTPTNTIAKEEKKEEEETKRQEEEAAEREAEAVAEVEAAMARLRMLTSNKASLNESIVMVDREPTTPPPSMEASITASEYVAAHSPPIPSVNPDLYYSVHEETAPITPTPEAPETEVKTPLSMESPQAGSTSQPTSMPHKAPLSHSASLDAILGSALKAAGSAVTQAAEAVSSALDSALAATNKANAASKAKWEPRLINTWTPPTPNPPNTKAWVPNATQTQWQPPQPSWMPSNVAPSNPIATAQQLSMEDIVGPTSEGGSDVGVGIVEEELDPRFVESMDILVSMGFADVEKNAALLRIHGNNLNSIVDTLLTDFAVVE